MGIGLLLLGSAAQVRAATGSTQARVRIVHASPDAPELDVYVNGTRSFRGLAFKEVSTYAKLDAGSYRLQAVPVGKTLAQGPIVISTTAKLKASTDYSVVAAGLRKDIEPLLLEDNNTLPDPSKAKVRFVHLSPDTASVNVVTPNDDNAKVFSMVGFEESADYVTLDAGRYNLTVQNSEDDKTLLSIKGLPAGNGQVITVFGMGLSEGQPALRAVVSVDAAATKLFPVTGDEMTGTEVTDMQSQAEEPFPVWSLMAIGAGLVLLALWLLPSILWRAKV
ncbi:MAG: DUF4397 domain-containing protein [Anaerolineae bacterium]|nr:DUF4397 domain-containing protein [Anaerolineae bacterium]